MELEQGKQPTLIQVPQAKIWRRYINKGDISNICSFCIMLVGLLIRSVYPDHNQSRVVLAFGLFAFSGGMTNWLAIKMLFDRIPGLIGSGVIPRHFKEIRQTVKDTIMGTFFDAEYLENYIDHHAKSMLFKFDLSKHFDEVLDKKDIDAILVDKLTEMSTLPEGAMIAMIIPMFGGVEAMTPMIKPMLKVFSKQMATSLTENFDPKTMISVDMVQIELDRLMSEKMELLTPEIVKELMEHVMRQHLGWLIVWGNIFGALIGVISELSGY